MKRYIAIFTAVTLCLAGCAESSGTLSVQDTPEVTSYEQQPEQLYTDEEHGYVPVNYSKQTGMWFPYMQYEEYMRGKSEEEFRESVRSLYSQAAEQSVNTVYLHVHPMGDAYYRSELFPKGQALDGDYDPFSIMLEEAHALGLSVHAWLNPLRCQTEAQMEELPDDFIIKRWTRSPELGIVKSVNGRLYLDPSHDETVELICGCVDEILSQYDVDGIHIDDYFYPTTEHSFDDAEFSVSGSSDLSEWRKENCTRFVKAIYDTVKAHDSRVLFGISPQGSIRGNYETQYADVRLWAGESGFCDYIVPQLYFGFRNESCPFERTLAKWEEMTCDDVALVIGLAVYKLGKSDKWAGAAGESEWIDDPEIIQKQIELVESSSAEGYALYC